MKHDNDELDRILDEGLATYSSREPWPGVEERVLSRVASTRVVAQAFLPVWFRLRTWRWAVLALPVAACLLLVRIMLLKPEHRTAPPVREMAEARTQPPVVRAPEPPRKMASRTRPRQSSLPKRAQFPTNAPLTPEERVLIELVTRAPQQARALLIEPARPETGPIEIEPIQIQPLESGNSSEDHIQ